MKKGNIMKINLKWQIALASALTMLLGASGVFAQSDSELRLQLQEMSQTLSQTTTATAGGRGGSVAFTTSFVSDRKTVTGAPYSAQIITESVQPFADGNAITHTSTSGVWRDSQGRTRREQNINMIGPSQASGAAVQVITIDDPVAGVHYTLNPNKMIATQITGVGTASSALSDTLARKVIPNDGSNVLFAYFSSDNSAVAGGGRGGSISVVPDQISATNLTTESLGADTMQGLSVLGTRVTRTIPAGQIGNAQPILIITDKWYSQDLQIEVKTVHSDPRTGTTTTVVTNLSRNEPNPALFAVPPGYTITTGGNGGGGGKVTLKQHEPI
jgi:hypothetical protein